MMVICLFVLWCFIWKCVGMCVWFNPLGQSVFQFANFDTFWKTWLRTCTCLILNIFCSPVVSMKSHLSLRTNTNVLILFLTTGFRRRKMTALFILYVFNSFHICLYYRNILHKWILYFTRNLFLLLYKSLFQG